jgi:tyrosine-protein kinase Etk/Wzc
MGLENENAVPPTTRPGARAAPPFARRAGSSAEPALHDVGRVLARGRWTIAGLTLLSLAAAAVYLLAAHRVYRATALMQMEEPPALRAELERLSPLLDRNTPIKGHIEIMRSRLVLGPVVDQLALDIVAEPRHFPVVGEALARRHRGALAAPAFGPSPFLSRFLSRFAWGGEEISVAQLGVPRDLLGEPLTLVALGGDSYRLADAKGRTLLDGRVGALASEGGVDLLVSKLTARPGTEFRVEKLRRDDVVDGIQRDLRIDEKTKDSGVIAIELDGRDPGRLVAIVSSLSSGFLREDMERRSAEAAKTLQFLESQLPKLKTRMHAAEAALVAFRANRRTVDLPVETRTTVERVAELDRTLADLASERAQLANRLTEQHPNLIALDRRILAVRAERAALDPRVQAMPDTEVGAARLVRNANVATELYVLLSNQAQMLQVAKAGMIGTVRLVDPPVVTRKPVSPKPVQVMVLGLVLGLGAGAALTILRRMFDDAAGDPQEIEAATGLTVFASIPHSDREAHLDRRKRAPRQPLALAAPDDPAVEHLRTVRTALGFVLNARGNVVAVSSPSPGAGKTFLCANLAHLFAAAGKRVLLVDADLRRGALHRYFSLPQAPGLADAVAGNVELEGAIRATDTPGLDLLARGALSPKPGELLATPRLSEILAQTAKRYDVVVVDTPPILAVADALLVERCASVNLLVVRARQHRVAEIARALEQLSKNGILVHGGILNDARRAGEYDGLYAHAGAGQPASAAG